MLLKQQSSFRRNIAPVGKLLSRFRSFLIQGRWTDESPSFFYKDILKEVVIEESPLIVDKQDWKSRKLLTQKMLQTAISVRTVSDWWPKPGEKLVIIGSVIHRQIGRKK